MKRRTRIILWSLGGLVGGLVLLLVATGLTFYVLGSRLPETHTATVSVDLPISQTAAFALISDFKGMKNWPGSGIDSVEELPAENGLPVVRQVMGGNSFVLRTTKFTPPAEIQRTISDDHQYFAGSWTYLIEPSPAGSKVTLTEVGTVKHALPRGVMQYVTGNDMYVKLHLDSMKAAAK